MESILYVDDDIDDQLIFCEVATAINPKLICHTAKDGREAFEVLEQLILLPEVIFLDLNMPGIGGKDFLSQIRSSERFKNLKVIIYSTSTNPRDIADCKKLGAQDFLSKPQTMEDIFTLLRKFISD